MSRFERCVPDGLAEEVLEAAENSGRRYVRATHLEDDVDAGTPQIGQAMRVLEDRGELELYDESVRRRLYMLPDD